MDILISVTDEPGRAPSIHHYDNPYMPKSVSNPYYTLEIREPDKDILEKIMGLIPLIKRQFGDCEEYIFETTSNGFKLKKRIEGGAYDQDSWDKWNNFSNTLYREIAKAVGIQSDN